MRHILLLGARGNIGSELVHTLAPLGTLDMPGRAEFDLAHPAALAALLDRHAPDMIVNAAAWTDVDGAETSAAAAHTVNAEAPAALARWAAQRRVPLLHYSTDYVFDGRKDGAYLESDPPDPLNAYGRSKLAGERAVAASGAPYLILRTSWVYGRGAHRNFLTTMRERIAAGLPLAAATDQFGAPTWSRHIAEASATLLAQWGAAPHTVGAGIVHCAAAGHTSRHGFARAIVEELCGSGADAPEVMPAHMDDFPAPASRPRNCRLDGSLLARQFGITLPHWRDGLHACLSAR